MNEKKVRFLRNALYISFGAFVVLWVIAFIEGCAPNPGKISLQTAHSQRVVL